MFAYDIPYWGMVIFVIGTVIAIGAGIVAGVTSMFRHRERRDGLE